MTRSEVEVDVLYMTRGEFGMLQPDAATPIDRQALAEIRTAEARAACEILGVSQVRFLNGADGKLHAQPELAAGLKTELTRRTYQRVFCPWHNDGHPDHRATYDLLMSVLRRAEARPNVWLYEVWSPLPHTMIVPIDATIEAKQRAIRAHASQLACLDYASAFQGLASYRALFCPPSKFAEAFLIHTW